MSTSTLDLDIAALATLSLKDLRIRWAQVTGRPVPKVRRTLLRLAIAYEMQAAVYGDLSRRTEQRLAWVSGRHAPEATAAPGARLLREWDGVLHSVLIDEEGVIHWDGRTWRSLSEVARAITGTRWSGPVFFGLRPKREAA